ncbi:hypothetical protein CDL12_15909 [Handroanthus impetiginosus]|uniref:Uncharacterized protein n=1 Tax=Handroanthus impetiginosus TaxID=429701 RepID=A0A2G9H1U1_9LAMI|nr:hypothetical protein CDL12_15909 [Handroanthus impetiginosus]
MDCKRSSSPNSGAIIGDNDDLLTEILIFLPPRSLIKLQLINKHWRSLILSPQFSRLHTFHHRSSKPQSSFLLRSTTSQLFICHPTVKKLVPFRFRFRCRRILQACNGLLLVECTNSHCGDKDYFVCNPTTGKYRKLSLSEEQREGISGVCIAFDPSKSPYYKVLCFRSNKGSDYVEVYDSETHTWKDRVKTSHVQGQMINGVCWNNGIYFIRPHLPSFYFCFKDDSDGIHRIRKIPTNQFRGAMRSHVMESNGHLHYVMPFVHRRENYVCVCVYEKNKEDRSWFLKYKANVNPFSDENNGTAMISLLGIIRGEREEDSILLFHVPGKIMVYRFIDEVSEFLFQNAHKFIETLAPV